MNNEITNSGVPDKELANCPKCGRNAPADRLKCLYCGESLGLSETQKRGLKAVKAGADEWERAYNVIYLPQENAGKELPISVFAELLEIDSSIAEEMFRVHRPIPVARLKDSDSAELVSGRFSELEVGCMVVHDDELSVQVPPKRLRGIEFLEDSLKPVLFNETGREENRSSPALIVNGFLNRKTVSSSEQRASKGGGLIDSSETGEDEAVLDFYFEGDGQGFRVRMDGFDFSCLGESRAFTAAENINTLAGELRNRFPRAAVSDSYRSLRRVLGLVWPQTESSAAEGVERRGFAGYAKRRSVTTDNELQFNRFSRLEYLLLGKSERNGQR